MFAKRMATVAGMAAFAAVVAAVPATADINSYATGSHAYSFGTQTRVAVKDTAADARHVYTNLLPERADRLLPAEQRRRCREHRDERRRQHGHVAARLHRDRSGSRLLRRLPLLTSPRRPKAA
jgi:hypothetical protein